MIYGVFILEKSGTELFKKFYGELKLDHELVSHFIKELAAFIQNIDQTERIECISIENLKYAYSLFEDVIFLLCTDKNEDEMYVSNKLIKLQKEFKLLKKASKVEKVENAVEQKETDKETEEKVVENIFEQFGQTVDEILFPFFKMAILGRGGVGKTSLLKLIIGEEPNFAYVPTVGVDVKEFDFEPKDTRLVFWDFSGQPRYRKLWQPFLEGADVAILVTDSKAESLTETKGILQMVKTEKPDVIVILVANKQDLPDAVPPEAIEKQIGIKAYGLVATDPKNREKMLGILKNAISDLVEAKCLQTLSLDLST
ncbi:MAG: ADP-ribosylation factor-like protein [Candidatus Freyarchaeum deiterrae]